MRVAWSIRFARAAQALACTAVLAGCAVTAEQRSTLAHYTEASQQVDRSAQQFLADYLAGVQAYELRRALREGREPAAPAEYPAELKLPEEARSLTQTEKDVLATRQALAVVKGYNDALVALASGQSQATIQSRLEGLASEFNAIGRLAGVALPALGPATQLVSLLVKTAQDAKNREELSRGVLAGRAHVDEILAGLEAQAKAMYQERLSNTQTAQDTLNESVQRTAESLKTSLFKFSPPADANLAVRYAALSLEMDRIARQLRMRKTAFPAAAPFSQGPAYDAEAQKQAEVLVGSMTASSQRYAELVARQNTYHDLLQKYLVALRATRIALQKLADSFSQPTDLREQASYLLKAAFDLRDAAERARAPALPAP